MVTRKPSGMAGRKSSSKSAICQKALSSSAIPKKRARTVRITPASQDTEEETSDTEINTTSDKTTANSTRKAKRSRTIITKTADVVRIEMNEAYCFSSYCANECKKWLKPGGVHIPLLALSDRVARQMQAAFESVNAKYRNCTVDKIRKPALAAWERHQECLIEMKVNKWPPLCAGPHHPDLYHLVRVKELGQERLYRVLKLPIPRELIPHIVGTLTTCGGPVLSKNCNIALVSKIRRNVTSYLTQGSTWENNTRVEPITDPRHPVYCEGKTAYRLVATKLIKKDGIIGPPAYAGALRKTSETDALELDMTGVLCDRWAYSFQVSIIEQKFDPELKKYVQMFDYKDDDDDEDESEMKSGTPTVSEDDQGWAGGLNGIREFRQGPDPKELPADLAMWDVEGGQFCNELSKANDRRGFGDILGFEPGEQLAPNCGAINWSLYNLPCIMYYALRDIKPGEEILMDYGHTYWSRQTVMSWCRGENNALKQERDRVLREKIETELKTEQIKAEREEVMTQLEQTKLQLEKAQGTEEHQLALRNLERLKKVAAAKTENLNAMQRLVEQRELAIRAVETKNDELKEKLDQYQYACSSKDETLAKMMKDSTQRSIFDTLGNTVQTRIAHVCVYSQIAEFIGAGAEHILSAKPERHYASCKYANMPFIKAQVIICEKCGMHYRSGTHALARHADDCELYREAAVARHQKLLDEAAGYDESVAHGVQHHLGDLAMRTALAKIRAEEKLTDLYGPLTNHSLLLTLIDLITHNARLTRFWTMIIFSCVKGYTSAVEPSRGLVKDENNYMTDSTNLKAEHAGSTRSTRSLTPLGKEFVRTLCAKELKVNVTDDEELRIILSNNYELAKILTGSHFNQILAPNMPEAFSWAIEFARVFVRYADDFANMKPEDISDSYLNGLKMHSLKMTDTLDYLEYSDIIKFDETDSATPAGRQLWTVQTDVRLFCEPLADSIRAFYSQFPWPSFPMPKLPNPTAVRAMLSSGSQNTKKQDKVESTKALPVKESGEIVKEESPVTQFDINDLELIASYFLLDENDLRDYESVGTLLKSKTFAEFDDDDPRVYLCLEVPDHLGTNITPPSIEDISIRSPPSKQWEPHTFWRDLGIVEFDVKDCFVIGSPARSITVSHDLILRSKLYWSVSLLMYCDMEDSFLEPQIFGRPDIDPNRRSFLQIIPLITARPPHDSQPIFSLGLVWNNHLVVDSYFLLFDFLANDFVRLSPSFALESESAIKRKLRNMPSKQRGGSNKPSLEPILPRLSRICLINRPGRGIEISDQTSNVRFVPAAARDCSRITNDPALRISTIGFANQESLRRIDDRKRLSAIPFPRVTAPLKQAKLSLARCDILQQSEGEAE